MQPKALAYNYLTHLLCVENIILKAENHSLAPHRSEIQSHPSQHTYTYIRAGLLLLAEVFSDFQHNPTIPRKYTLAFEHLSLYVQNSRSI